LYLTGDRYQKSDFGDRKNLKVRYLQDNIIPHVATILVLRCST
jgi:hypothetical protein